MSTSTSYFNNSHDFQVQRLTINNNQIAGASKAFEHLHDNIAADAIHNSDERCSIPNCYPETRKAVQGEIHSWITDGDEDAEPKKIMWLTGPAGAGKTAIAGSIAEICEDKGILAGSFFFSSFAGSESRRTKRCLVATLVYCLLQHEGLQQLRAPILSVIERDPSIFRKSLSAQFKVLILKPLRDVMLQLVQSVLPKVIIIDGLDEVEAASSKQLGAQEARLANEAEQAEILSALLLAAHNPDFPFRILVVSRPEPVIRDFFSHKAGYLTREVFLDETYDPGSDIALFLNAKFTEIRRRYKLPNSWPGEEVLQLLRDNSSGQFIYAATAVRFLQSPGAPPQARLECLLRRSPANSSSHSNTAFSPLDALYTRILSSSPDPISSTHLIAAINFIGLAPALFVRLFLQDYRGQTDYLLDNLASLLLIPPIEDDASPFEVYHKSLFDFFQDPGRCGDELHEALEHGETHFLLERIVRVFDAKSPVVPMTENEWHIFLEPYLHLFLKFNGWVGHWACKEEQTAWDDSLALCDMLWWVRIVCDVYREHEDTGIICDLFENTHIRCQRQGNCNALCKCLRSDIISGCRALGWRVPNASALLHEKLESEVHGKPGVHFSFSFRKYFEPRGGRVDTGSGSSSNAARDDYESMRSVAASLYSRLPKGWLERYSQERSRGRDPFNALQLEILRVTRAWGVDVEHFRPPSFATRLEDSDESS